jgi:hypothetical protein
MNVNARHMINLPSDTPAAAAVLNLGGRGNTLNTRMIADTSRKMIRGQ